MTRNWNPTLAVGLAIMLFVVSLNEAARGAGEYRWTARIGRQGAFSFDAVPSTELRRKYGNRRIRLINIVYTGPSSLLDWRSAFFDAASYYERENVSFPHGGNYRFTRIKDVSNSRKRIVGWYDYTLDQYGFLVITGIDQSRGLVYYTTSDGQSWKIGGNTGNFERWRLGGTTFEHPQFGYVSIQIWKDEDTARPDAAVSLTLQAISTRSSVSFMQPMTRPRRTPRKVLASHFDQGRERTYVYQQSGGPQSRLRVIRPGRPEIEIHNSRYVGSAELGGKPYWRYRVTFTNKYGPDWVLRATNEDRYEIWFPKGGDGFVRYSEDRGQTFVPEFSVPMAGFARTHFQ